MTRAAGDDGERAKSSELVTTGDDRRESDDLVLFFNGWFSTANAGAFRLQRAAVLFSTQTTAMGKRKVLAA